MRIECKNKHSNLLVLCKNGGSSLVTYECFKRVNDLGADIEDSENSILVTSDYFDFDIILKIRDGYIYCEVHTNKEGNFDYTVIYSYKEMLLDIVKKLNELIFETTKFKQLSMYEKKTLVNCVAWYYNMVDTPIPNLPYGLTVLHKFENYDIFSKTKEGMVECEQYIGKMYSDLLNIMLWGMVSTGVAVSIMNWDSDIVALYADVDNKMLGIQPYSGATLIQCFCELVRLAIEVKTGYRTVTVEDDVLSIGVEEELDINTTELKTEEEITQLCIELGYNLDKFDTFRLLYLDVVKGMLSFGFTYADFGIECGNNSNEFIIPRYLHLEGGEWV